MTRAVLLLLLPGEGGVLAFWGVVEKVGVLEEQIQEKDGGNRRRVHKYI